MSFDLFLRIQDVSSELGYSDMWVTDAPSYEDGVDMIKSPPENVLRIMREQGAVFKLADGEGTALAFSRTKLGQRNIRWITNDMVYGNYDEFGVADLLWEVIGLNHLRQETANKKHIKSFGKHFLKSWKESNDAELMMILCQTQTFNDGLMLKLMLVACDIINMTILSRGDNVHAQHEYMEALGVVRNCVENDISQLTAIKAINALSGYSGRWLDIARAMYVVFNSPKSVPIICLLFSAHTDVSIKANSRLSLSDFADVIRSKISTMEVLDMNIVPATA